MWLATTRHDATNIISTCPTTPNGDPDTSNRHGNDDNEGWVGLDSLETRCVSRMVCFIDLFYFILY